jgi:hypothetical protein
MGEALGEGLRDQIAVLVDRRTQAAADYLVERGLEPRTLDDLGTDCLHVLRGWDEPAWVEHRAVARASGIDAGRLYAMINLTDIRDLACVPAQHDAEGCTAVLAAAGSTSVDGPLGGQTWDLSSGDVDSIVAVHRRPDEGPRTWAVTVAGAPTLMGMNEDGLALGTTNIRVAGARVGVGYMSLLHKAITCADRREAVEAIDAAPRIAAHTYWFVDPRGAIELECDAMSCSRREPLGQDVLVRTNHCLHEDRIDSEVPLENSLRRLDRAQAFAQSGTPIDVDNLRALFCDRSDALCSINRKHSDGEPTATNACVIADPAARVLHACRGEADRGQWVVLGF